MKTFCIGDIHGRADALKEVLVKCKFDYKKDKLIVLGDIVDGGTQTNECVEELLKIKNLVYIWGNHDLWFINWMRQGIELPVWYHQGGIETIRSYGGDYTLIPVTHQYFFNRGLPYYQESGMIFVHGGFNPNRPIEEQPIQDLVWDRELISYAKNNVIKGYKHVFVGHTTTQFMGKYINIKDITKPVTLNNLTMMDTGAGWDGKLTIMDVMTKEFWQSQLQNPGRNNGYRI